MFANCQMGGMNMATPDVCKTPSPPGAPVPIPYPNIAQGATANPGTAAKKVLISGAPAHTLQTTIPMSNGDNAGVVGGVMSGMIMGPSRHLMGATNVLIGGNPATKMTDQTGQNGSSQNVPGSTIAPAQTKVMIMSGGSGGGGGSSSKNATNSLEESEERNEPTVTNPRWEHVDENMKEESPDIVLADDVVALMVDVSNITDGTTVTFKIFDTSTGKRVGMVLGEVSDGVGLAEWCVRTSSRGKENIPSFEFEAIIRGLTSGRVEIGVGDDFRFSV